MATHLGPKSLGLKILINQFKYLGCEGSGVYGVPRPIELFIGISETMDKFREFCEKEKTGSPKKSRLDDPAKLSSPCPQVENGSFSDNECNVTQRGFATQVPHTLSTNSSLVEGSEGSRLNHRISLQSSSKSEATARSGCQKTANSPTKSPKAKSGILEFAKENIFSSGKTKGKASNNAHDLLLLLSDKQISKPKKPSKPVTLPPVTLRTEVKGSRADQQDRLIPKAAAEFRIEENDSKTIEPSDGVNGKKSQEAESLEERLGINGAVAENSDLQVDTTLSTWTTSHVIRLTLGVRVDELTYF